jgi:RNA polymerase sigma factor for flagellar operon FliA
VPVTPITSETQRYEATVKSLAAQIKEGLPIKLTLEKLIESGKKGLIEALKEFKKGQGIPFNCFAFYRIRGAIYEDLNQIEWDSQEVRAHYLFCQKANQFLQWYSSSSEAFVKRTMEAEAEEMSRLSRNLFIIALLCIQSVDSSLLAPATLNQFRTALARLEEQDRLLIQSCYFENKRIQEAASQLNVPISHAQRIHLKILSFLREALSDTAEQRTV